MRENFSLCLRFDKQRVAFEKMSAIERMRNLQQTIAECVNHIEWYNSKIQELRANLQKETITEKQKVDINKLITAGETDIEMINGTKIHCERELMKIVED